MSPVQGRCRQSLEEEWSRRLREALTVYRQASDHHQEMIKELKQALSEERYAVSRARRAEAWARSELKRTVCIYAALVVDGKAPPPGEDERLLC